MSELGDLSTGWVLLLHVHVCVGIGLIVSRLDRRHPGRAHLFLRCGLAAAALVLAAGWTVGWLELGQLPRAATTAAQVRIESRSPAGSRPVLEASAAIGPATFATSPSDSAADSTSLAPGASGAGDGPRSGALIVSALTLWLLASGAMSWWVARSWRAGRRLALEAPAVGDERLVRGFKATCAEFGLPDRTQLVESAAIASPVIWCFGSRPRMLLPSVRDASVDWTSVFRHECAHWRRGDHWFELGFEVLRALVPWHPFTWGLLRSHQSLSELACDDWAARDASSRCRFAETLLRLVPQRVARIGMPAARSRPQLEHRVRHLLQGAGATRSSRSFLGSASLGTAVFSAGLALVQPGAPEPAAATQAMTVTGRVLDADARPIPGAEVVLCEHSCLLRASDGTAIARMSTDESGRFDLKAAPPGNGLETMLLLLVAAPGKGTVLRSVPPGPRSRSFTILLEPERRLEGRVIDLQGVPVAGAGVLLEDLHGPDAEEGRYASIQGVPLDLELQRRVGRSDADGRFRLPGIARSAGGKLRVEHAGYAPELCRFDGDGKGAQAPLSVVLEPHRVLEGRLVGDSDEPVAGARIEIASHSASFEEHGYVAAETDEAGRFEASIFAWPDVTLVVRPEPGSPYRAFNHDLRWDDTTVRRTVDLRLRKGVVLHGRIVDAETGAPVVDAQVRWFARESDNPDFVGSDVRYGDPVASGEDGAFVLTGVPGAGTLLVNANDEYVARRVDVQREIDPRVYGTLTVHGLFPVDVPATEARRDLGDFKLRRGVRLRGRAVDADGAASRHLAVVSPSFSPYWQSIGNDVVRAVDGLFEIPGLDPGASHVLYLLDDERRLGATVTLVPPFDAMSVRTVTLKPCAIATARFHCKDGKPLADHELEAGTPFLSLGLLIADGPDPSGEGFPADPPPEWVLASRISGRLFTGLRTDALGNARWPALIPEAPYHLLRDFRRCKAIRVEPGATIDLGTIDLLEAD